MDQKQNRWVIKIGSSLLTKEGAGLDLVAIEQWVDQMVYLRRQGVAVLLVSSGAVAAGLARLGVTARPKSVHKLQAAAAIGQMGLVQSYESAFQKHQLLTAQVLLTHDDLSNRTRYLNARNTLLELLALGVVPIINENDTVVTEEIRFGDNDTLAALVANLVEAEKLIILTDQQGLYDKDPRKHPDAALIPMGRANSQELLALASSVAGEFGRGGMFTKVKAAGLAARSGARTVIASGKESGVIERLARGERLGTLLEPEEEPWAARKQWLAGHLQMKGALVLDNGAAKVLRAAGSSLLPVGVTDVVGTFQRGDMVACRTADGERVACGLVNYSSDESKVIKGKSSDQILPVLGYVDSEELIHRDNMIIF